MTTKTIGRPRRRLKDDIRMTVVLRPEVLARLDRAATQQHRSRQDQAALYIEQAMADAI